MAYVKCLMNVVSSTIPDGKTVTPTDDVSILLACAERTETYTTISALLADATALAGVISSNNAIDYLVRSTTFASDVCGDSGAMTNIGANNYASNTLLANATWCAAICNSTYFESVLNVKVPVMTSNTTPSGVCSASSVFNSTTPAWKAFNNDTSTKWQAQTVSYPQWLQYEFADSVKIHKIAFVGLASGGGTGFVKEFYFQSSNDGFVNDSHDLVHETLENYTTTKMIEYSFTNISSYLYYRLYFVSTYATNNYFGTTYAQFYGRADI